MNQFKQFMFIWLVLISLLVLGYGAPAHGTLLVDNVSKRPHYLKCVTAPTVVTPNRVVLSSDQVQLLRSAWYTASNIPSIQGTTWNYTITSIGLRESSAGKCRVGDIQLPYHIRCDPSVSSSILLDTILKHDDWRSASYGPYQMQIRTVRQVANVYDLAYTSQISDEQIVHLLLTDQEYALRLAIMYLNWLERTSQTYFQVVSRYNGGWANMPYYLKIQQDMRTIQHLENMGCFD